LPGLLNQNCCPNSCHSNCLYGRNQYLHKRALKRHTPTGIAKSSDLLGKCSVLALKAGRNAGGT
jgi:hypothetical protein